MGSKRLGIVLAILAVVTTSLTHLATERSHATDVVFHLGMLVLLLAGLALIMRNTIDYRERAWCMAVLAFWGATVVSYVAWIGALAILAGGAGLVLIVLPEFRKPKATGR